jgi:hypothetical protein
MFIGARQSVVSALVPCVELAPAAQLAMPLTDRSELVTCLNAGYKGPASGLFMDWDNTMDNAVENSTYKVVAAFWSNHDVLAPITAVTSSSVRRIVACEHDVLFFL